MKRAPQVCIAVRDTHGIGNTNPLPFFAVKQRIEAALSAHAGRFVVVPISPMCLRPRCSYVVEWIVLDVNIKAISATQLRRLGTER